MRISDHLDVYWDTVSIAKKKKMLRHLFTEMKLPEPFRPHSESPSCGSRLVDPAIYIHKCSNHLQQHPYCCFEHFVNSDCPFDILFHVVT